MLCSVQLLVYLILVCSICFPLSFSQCTFLHLPNLNLVKKKVIYTILGICLMVTQDISQGLSHKPFMEPAIELISYCEPGSFLSKSSVERFWVLITPGKDQTTGSICLFLNLVDLRFCACFVISNLWWFIFLLAFEHSHIFLLSKYFPWYHLGWIGAFESENLRHYCESIFCYVKINCFMLLERKKYMLTYFVFSLT